MKLALLCFFALAFTLVSVARAQPRQSAVLESSTQLLMVTTPDWNAMQGMLRRYERVAPHKKWRAIGAPIAVVVGKTGLAWGLGAVAVGPEARNAADPVKKEGDGKAPAGVFTLGTAFGYAAQQEPGWKVPYLSLTPSIECVDDPRSKFYNQVVDRNAVAPDWNSSEHMRRSDDLYRWGMVVNHNANPAVPGAGSCIFLHIWGGPAQATVGCTAMPQPDLESVLAWLDPTRKPLLVQLPIPQYKKLRKRWKLPAFTSTD